MSNENPNFKDMLAVIIRGKDYSKIKDMNTLFWDAESIISTMAYLIKPLMDSEQTYRKLSVAYMEAGDSHAKAEAKAKCSDEYNDYKKNQMVYDLANEQVMLIKKFGTELKMEYNRH